MVARGQAAHIILKFFYLSGQRARGIGEKADILALAFVIDKLQIMTSFVCTVCRQSL
jgi:hypothetical protein